MERFEGELDFELRFDTDSDSFSLTSLISPDGPFKLGDAKSLFESEDSFL